MPSRPLWMPGGAALFAALAALAALAASAAQAQAVIPLAAYQVAGDAITEPLTAQAGDAARGRAIVANRQAGLCLLCHSGPFPEERFQGDLAPSLAGAGARWTEGQLRLRIVDSRRLNPQTIMPSYHRIDNLARVGAVWRERPVLTAQQIEDVVAFLRSLRD
ncbi:MAG TPA: sulfur oxidation c-type cytochrome SoxX [Burkholderiaceae bacterium]|nr:sulfur oxidation c-type cytochrome SoxX [Burkholderiaceae bacterium]